MTHFPLGSLRYRKVVLPAKLIIKRLLFKEGDVKTVMLLIDLLLMKWSRKLTYESFD